MYITCSVYIITLFTRKFIVPIRFASSTMESFKEVVLGLEVAALFKI